MHLTNKIPIHYRLVLFHNTHNDGKTAEVWANTLYVFRTPLEGENLFIDNFMFQVEKVSQNLKAAMVKNVENPESTVLAYWNTYRPHSSDKSALKQILSANKWSKEPEEHKRT